VLELVRWIISSLDVVLIHLLFENSGDDATKLLAFLLRQFSRLLRDCVQFRILMHDPLDGLCRRVLSHKEWDLFNPLLRYQGKDFVSSFLVGDLSGGETGVDLLLF
jgi:hypothetical protein